MPPERVSMKKIRDVLRLTHTMGMSRRKVSEATGIGRTAVSDYVQRAAIAGLSWPLPEGLDDPELERRLYPPSDAAEAQAIHDLLFKAAAEATIKIAADPKHLGARIGITVVLHTWGSAMTHHPHVHMIVPGGGLSADGTRWIACRSSFFLPVRVLSRLFRRLFLSMLTEAHSAGQLMFFGNHEALAEPIAFAAMLKPLRKVEWLVYAKKPFGGLEAVLAYLSRYTHRVAISNRRLIAAGADTVTFRFKNYRIEGPERYKTMTLATGEFIRRFLMHVLPKGFHRIRHYGFLASGAKAGNLARARELLAGPEVATAADANEAALAPVRTCPCCGGPMHVIEIFEAGQPPRHQASPRPVAIRIDTS